MRTCGRLLTLVLLGSLVVNCASPPTSPATARDNGGPATATQPSAQTIAPTFTPSPSFASATATTTASPLPTATSAITPVSLTPTPQSGVARIEPLVTSGRIIGWSWAPDGETFAYWTLTPQEVKVDYLYPPGTLHFLNARTGQRCEPPFSVGYGYWNNHLEWLPDGRVLIIADEKLRLHTPCRGDFTLLKNPPPGKVVDLASHDPDRSHFLVSTLQGRFLYQPATQSVRRIDESVGGAYAGYSWSPSARRLAVTGTAESQFVAGTWVVDVPSGKVLDVVKWKYFDAEGNFAGPTWLNEDQFLVEYSLDRGPLLVTIGKGMIEVAPKLFGRPSTRKCEPQPCEIILIATGAAVKRKPDFHIALSTMANGANSSNVLLYHSEDQRVEELAARERPSFSPDGRWIVLRSLAADTGANQLQARPLDPTDHATPILLARDDEAHAEWSPNSKLVAVWSGTQVTVYAVAKARPIGSWDLGYEIVSLIWSPRSSFLGVQAHVPGVGGAEGLFVLPVPTS